MQNNKSTEIKTFEPFSGEISSGAGNQSSELIPFSPAFLTRAFLYLDAPPSVKKLNKLVHGWFTKANKGQMNSVDDLSLSFGGMSGTFPNIHFLSFAACEYAESNSERATVYNDLINLIDNGLKGLIAYSHSDNYSAKDGPYNYQGPIRTAADLMKKRDRLAPSIRVDSLLEKRVLDRFEDAVLRSYHRLKTESDTDHINHLTGHLFLSEYGFDSYNQYSPNLNQRTKSLFTDIVSKMDPEDRNKLERWVSHHYTDEYEAFVKGLIKEADTYKTCLERGDTDIKLERIIEQDVAFPS